MVSQPQRVKYSLCKQAAKLRDAQEGEGDVGGGRGGWLCEGPSWCVEPICGAPSSPLPCPPCGEQEWSSGGSAGGGGDFAAMFNIQVT